MPEDQNNSGSESPQITRVWREQNKTLPGWLKPGFQIQPASFARLRNFSPTMQIKSPFPHKPSLSRPPLDQLQGKGEAQMSWNKSPNWLNPPQDWVHMGAESPVPQQIEEICQDGFAVSDIKNGVSKTQYKFLQAPARTLLDSTGLFNQHNHPGTSQNQEKAAGEAHPKPSPLWCSQALPKPPK